MENLTVGRTVHVVASRTVGEGENAVTHRVCQSAVVVKVWEDEPKAYVNLVVTRDGTNDSKYDGLGYMPDGKYNSEVGSALQRWDTSVYEGQESRQFHDPRECAVEQAA